MSLRGNPGNLRALAQKLRQLPRDVARNVAAEVAPKLTALAQSAYDGGRTVYGDARPEGKHGPLTLVESGATRRDMRAAATGTSVRFVLGPRWAKYLVGKYRILPGGDLVALPDDWSRTIGDTAREVLARQTRQVAA